MFIHDDDFTDLHQIIKQVAAMAPVLITIGREY